MRLMILALTAILLTSCTANYEDQAQALYRHVERNRIGDSPDYYLVKASGMAGAERVALVYAMMDDFAFCDDLARFYMEKHSGDQYTCEKAN